MMCDRRPVRAGQAASAAAARRRDLAAHQEHCRQHLARYWQQHTAHAPHGLPPRWTSELYYQQAERDARELQARQSKQHQLEERRNKLNLLFFHENLQYQEELKNLALQNKLHKRSSYLDAVPTSVLRDVNLGIAAKEESRRRQEAELMLYHQWRSSHPIIRRAERTHAHRALKSAWMEQTLEKEVAKKREEEDTERLLKERDENIKRQIEKEREEKLVKEEKMKEHREKLCRQIEELRVAELAAADLRHRQLAAQQLLDAAQAAAQERDSAAQRRHAARHVAISNMTLHARRLRERAREAEKDVEADLKELTALLEAVEKDIEERDVHRTEWRSALKAAQESMEQQRHLERLRQKRLEDAMDGEARAMAHNQERIWQQEHAARQALLSEVVETLKLQAAAKVEECKRRQQQNIRQREDMLAHMEGLGEANKENEQQKHEIRKATMLQAQLKQMQQEDEELAKKREREKQLQEAEDEEERLKMELIKLQEAGGSFHNFRRRRVVW